MKRTSFEPSTPSISDVARVAGVSQTSVSHVLTGRRPVSTKMRSKVLKAVNALGYVPDHAAQSLARGSTRTIGVLVPNLTNDFFSALVSSIERSAMASGYSMLLGITGWNVAETEVQYLQMLRAKAVDGFVYATGAGGSASAELHALVKAMPAVAVDEELSALVDAAIVSDNYGGGRMVAEHLAGLGHTKALIVGPNPSLASATERCRGFADAWAERGCDDLRIENGTFDESSGLEIVSRLSKSIGPRRYSALFAVNDLIAVGALRALHDGGRLVPEECSVVGFDDSWVAGHSYPKLTTVRQDTETLGTSAVESILAQLRGDNSHVRKVVPVTLVVRESSGPLTGRARKGTMREVLADRGRPLRTATRKY